MSDVVSGKLMGQGVINKDILIDEAPMVLQNLLSSLGMRGGISAITLTEK